MRERTTLPMILDEVIPDVPSLLRAYAANGLEAFNLKLSRVGGLSKAKLLRDLAVELGLRVTIEDTWGGDLTTAAVAAAGGEHAARGAVHRLLHERLDERARPATGLARRRASAPPRTARGWA